MDSTIEIGKMQSVNQDRLSEVVTQGEEVECKNAFFHHEKKV
jgi:hypothetical protein